MAIQIKRMKLAVEKVGKIFEMTLPHDARIERVGISPADGEPSLWYTVRSDDSGEVVRSFVVVMDDGIVDDNHAFHTGIWWEGNHTFHLYEHPTTSA